MGDLLMGNTGLVRCSVNVDVPLAMKMRRGLDEARSSGTNFVVKT